MAELRDIIKGLVVSEKASSDSLMANNTYTFKVGIDSNKPQIKRAIETVFDVKVKSVRTLIMYGEERRVGRFSGKTSNWKKAYVKLHEDYSLQHLFFNDEEEE
jgi:large subunit ribosomal protein L23